MRRDRIESAVARGLARLPERAQRRIGGPPPEIDGQRLSQEMQLLLTLGERAGVQPFTTLPVEEARRQIEVRSRAFGGPSAPMAEVRDVSVPGPAGPVAARFYVPHRTAPPRPLLVYFHGGGHTIGSLDSADSVCRLLGAHAGVAVLSVDYRMGPEHRFPAAVEDSIAAFDFVVAEADKLGVDPDRVAVGGDSAGGNLAAVVALQRRGADGPAPAFQLLIYPVCDLTAERRSRELFADGFLLTRQGIAWYRDHYMGPDNDRSDPRASIILTEDLSGVAPAYVVTAGFDPLRDEGEEYAARLAEAGNLAAVRRHPGLVHGFANMTGFGLDAREAVMEMAGALRLGLAVAGRP